MSKKLSKSDSAGRVADGQAVQEILSGLTDSENRVVLSEAVGAIIDSAWLRQERQDAFRRGVLELAELLGTDDDYTLSHIVDPYEEKK